MNWFEDLFPTISLKICMASQHFLFTSFSLAPMTSSFVTSLPNTSSWQTLIFLFFIQSYFSLAYHHQLCSFKSILLSPPSHSQFNCSQAIILMFTPYVVSSIKLILFLDKPSITRLLPGTYFYIHFISLLCNPPVASIKKQSKGEIGEENHIEQTTETW